MAPEQWERIKTLFESALNLPEQERETYLDGACNDDPEIRPVLDTLLEHHESALPRGGERANAFRAIFSEGDLVAGRFRIVRFLNRGGIGEVFEAYDERLRLSVALKTLRGEFTADLQAVERFRREIRLAREVAHPNLCRVFDLVEHRPPLGGLIPCLTMELLAGESMVSRLQRTRPMETTEALPLIRQIGAALAALHSSGIVHRDLKPSNIMLAAQADGSSRAIVTDFGLAKVFDRSGDFFESVVDLQAGAPYYIAPELLRGKQATAAADIYAFGLVIDDMVASVRAFSAESVQSLLFQKLWEKPLAPSARGSKAPAHWDEVILRCLNQQPSERYASVEEIVEALFGTAKAASVPSCLPPVRAALFTRRVAIASTAVTASVLAVSAVSAALFVGRSESVLVFSIVNQTDRPDVEYLCQGTTYELTRRLSQVDKLRVIPYYEPRPKAFPANLRADFALDGILQLFESIVRVSMQLTDRDGQLVWSQSFQRHLESPLELQSDIAEGAVRAIEQRVTSGPGSYATGMIMSAAPIRRLFSFQTSAARPLTFSDPAFDLYLRGRQLWSEMTVKSSLEALQLFQQATRIDPAFAFAYTAIADCQLVLMDYDYAPFPELLQRARTFSERAVTLGPELAETHTSFASVQQMSWEWAAAGRTYRDALRLNPRYARARRYYGGMLIQFGQHDSGLAYTKEALELDPYDYASQAAYGLMLFYARRYDEAIRQLNHTLSQKDLLYAHVNLGEVYGRMGQTTAGEAAVGWFRKALEQAEIVARIEQNAVRPPGSDAELLRFSDRMYAEYHGLMGNRQAAEPYLNRLVKDMRAGRTSPAMLAVVFTTFGEHDQALELLEQAVSERDRKLLYVNVTPFLEPLHSSGRFQAVLKQMKFPHDAHS
jgi:serine/threonine protein kinase/tetratricopeptide (TPR) repeat protein